MHNAARSSSARRGSQLQGGPTWTRQLPTPEDVPGVRPPGRQARSDRHGLPVKIFTRSGDLYLARTDTDEDGNPLSLTGETADEFSTDMNALMRKGAIPTAPTPTAPVTGSTPITDDEVEARFEAEVGAADK
jgi:hypothetical protein